MKPNKSMMTCACALLASALVSGGADSAPTYDQKTNVVYGEVHGTGLLMDVFTPKGKPNGLGVVDVVSGAYSSDRGKIRDHTLAQLYTILCSHGYTVFAVRPGSKSRYTGGEMVANVKTGIRFVKQHAADYKIDPERLGLTGASAGGNLALLVALTQEDGKPEAKDPIQRQDTKLKAASVFFPPTDFLDWDGKPAGLDRVGDLFFVGGTKGHAEEDIKEQARRLSPARLVNGAPIPLLLFHGDADPVVPLQQSQKFVEAVKAAGGSIELIVKKGGAHPWFTMFEEVKVMADWFDKQLAEKKSGEPAASR